MLFFFVFWGGGGSTRTGLYMGYALFRGTSRGFEFGKLSLRFRTEGSRGLGMRLRVECFGVEAFVLRVKGFRFRVQGLMAGFNALRKAWVQGSTRRPASQRSDGRLCLGGGGGVVTISDPIDLASFQNDLHLEQPPLDSLNKSNFFGLPRQRTQRGHQSQPPTFSPPPTPSCPSAP